MKLDIWAGRWSRSFCGSRLIFVTDLAQNLVTLVYASLRGRMDVLTGANHGSNPLEHSERGGNACVPCRYAQKHVTLLLLTRILARRKKMVQGHYYGPRLVQALIIDFRNAMAHNLDVVPVCEPTTHRNVNIR